VTVGGSLVVIIVLMNVSVLAEEGPIRRAIARDAARLAAEQGNVAQRPGGSVGAPWSRVQNLVPGTDVKVVIKGQIPVLRYFVSADSSTLMVANLPQLPSNVATKMVRLLADRPDVFVAGSTEQVVAGQLRVAPDGIFMRGQKIIDRDRVVETVARYRVAKIAGPREPDTWWSGLRGAGVGLGAGLLAGYVSAWSCQIRNKSECELAGIYVGAGAGLFGAVAGGIIGTGIRSAAADRYPVIYAAP
jgi:hypothetical protein